MLNSSEMIDMLKAMLFVFCLLIGYYGYKKSVVDLSGLLSSLFLGICTLLFLPIIWFFPLLMLFVTGGLTAKYKWEYKKKIGVSEGKSGRGVYNVLGNGSVALFSAIFFYFIQDDLLIYMYICSLAAACADSIATELGQLSKKKPRLIINFKETETGTTGAISLLGELSALLGAFIIAVLPFLYFGFLGFWNIRFLLIVIVSGFIACQIDSLIGATLELKNIRKEGVGITKFFNNHTTNLLATFSGALIGASLYLVF